jgi:hypothetical protein
MDRMRQLQQDEKIDLVVNRRVSLRVYANCRPHVFQTAKLQKGAIIVCNGMELVEEGLGIGVPVCRYRDGTRFSLSAETYVNDSETNPRITKIYDLNAIASKRFRGTRIRRGRYLANLLKVLEKWYRGLRRYTAEATLMLDMLSLLGMKNEYLESHSKGRITVTYCCSGRELKINAALDRLCHEGLQSVAFANEQGGRLFDEYTDSTGIRLHGREVEPWRITRAERAALHSRELGVGFSLQRPTGWQIVRGREVVRDRISWSGLDLLYNGIPQTPEYRVQIIGDSTID